MMDYQTILLPYPPSVNHYYIKMRSGHVALSVQARNFRKNVWAAVKEQKIKPLGKMLIYAEFLICPPDRRKRDFDNVFKATLDALELAHVFDDDSQVVAGRFLKKMPSVVKKGYMRVKLCEFIEGKTFFEEV